MQEDILITGGGGFIGTHLVKKLSYLKRYRFEKLNRSKFPFSNPQKLTPILKGKDIIVHLAAKIGGSLEEQKKGNIESIRGLLRGIEVLDKTERPRLFILASTFAVYKEQKKKITEETKLEPRNDYGKTKLKAENLLKKYAERVGISALILRPSNVYGPGIGPFSHSVVATFIEWAKRGESLFIEGNGTQARDFLYVNDVVDAFTKALRWKGKKGEVLAVNVCSGKATSMNDLVRSIEKLLAKKIKVVYRNPKRKDTACWIGDFSRAEKILSWRPKTSLAQGLRKTINEKKN